MVFIILKCVGAAYLPYLAWLSFRAGALPTHAPDDGKAVFPGCWPSFRSFFPVAALGDRPALWFNRSQNDRFWSTGPPGWFSPRSPQLWLQPVPETRHPPTVP
ncbi:hypothetical protein [uncultured Desulfovibrio sp.]|uniref:hypothetical protein n=1 Tax=uncultured Desulfovibrio sp. TaxID=167968 RepID=UPI002633D562|nr:hypothetical protein [uncultured Desulfovibrio sp.]